MSVTDQIVRGPRALLHHETVSLVSVDGRPHALVDKLVLRNQRIPYFSFEDENWLRINEIETSQRSQVLVLGNLQSVKTSFLSLALLETGLDVFFLLDRPEYISLPEWARLQREGAIPMSPITCLSEIEYSLGRI